MIIGDLRLPGFEITIYFDHEGNIYGHMGISSTAAPNAGEITTTTVALLRDEASFSQQRGRG
jgi:hypothetical protein